jgi:hypothetical protein
MKSLLIYYFAILLPLPLLAWSLYNNYIMFFILLISYLIYRSFVDGQRLIEKELIGKKEFWKVFIPLWRYRYFKELFFEV